MKIELQRLTLKNTFQLQSIVKKDVAEQAYLEWPFTKEYAENFITNYNTWGIWINGNVLVGAVEVKENLFCYSFVAKSRDSNTSSKRMSKIFW